MAWPAGRLDFGPGAQQETSDVTKDVIMRKDMGVEGQSGCEQQPDTAAIGVVNTPG